MAKRKVYNDGLTAKQRYFKRVYDEAPMIDCACGCGEQLKSKDKYARDVKYVNGHNGRKYDDPKQYKREWNHRHRAERHSYKTKRAYDIRCRLIAELGNKCVICGLEHDGQNTPAFDFHHKDPSTKLFNINADSISNKRKLADVEAEAKKCEILCSNCHRIHHWNEHRQFMEDVEE